MDDLSRLRSIVEEQVGHSDFMLARLDIDGQTFYGINAHGEAFDKPEGVTFQGQRHAEGHALSKARRAGASGGEATLYVDGVLPPCQWCKSSFAGFGRALDLDWLTVIGPNGYLGRYTRGGGYETIRKSF